ncbi:MAG: adenylate/guanylate cyclase domain-containing protein [Pirellulales bacterium]
MSTAAGRTIVIAEDSRVPAMILTKALESRGHVVHWAADGGRALDLVREHRPAILISDVEMPEMDGHALCQAVKSDPELRRIPVLMLTSLAATSDILAGLRAGADAYVTKPYEPAHILDRVDHLLAQDSARDRPGEPLEIEYAGETLRLDVTRRQLLNLLLSTYENILQQNTKLAEMHRELGEANRRVEDSLRKTRDLLYRVFPRQIADELADRGASEPRHFASVTVLFTDFVGFTKTAETMPPRELIAGLDRYFLRFDQLLADCGMEKLKTIGDAYMAAAGVPEPAGSHAVDAAAFALRLREAAAEIGRERQAAGQATFPIRIGLHSGPLVAGVIGEQRFLYDLWGDTVNTAARMESTGEPGRINVSGVVERLIAPWFECTPRGLLEVKGKGAVEMFFLERLKPEFSADESGTVGNEAFAAARSTLRAASGRTACL